MFEDAMWALMRRRTEVAVTHKASVSSNLPEDSTMPVAGRAIGMKVLQRKRHTLLNAAKDEVRWMQERPPGEIQLVVLRTIGIAMD